jgi:3-deoxy-D-manno-octulosonic-acid transferase
MSRYFLYVHPCLPVINEAEFWPMLNQEATVKSSFSLLVFQAMMFAACSVCVHIQALKQLYDH